MQTIIIILNPEKLKNPNADLRYYVPDRIEEVSNGMIQGNGYDYLDCQGAGSLMGIWLKTESASENYPIVVNLFQKEKFLDNDLSLSAEIYISENDTEDIDNCILVFPK